MVETITPLTVEQALAIAKLFSSFPQRYSIFTLHEETFSEETTPEEKTQGYWIRTGGKRTLIEGGRLDDVLSGYTSLMKKHSSYRLVNIAVSGYPWCDIELKERTVKVVHLNDPNVLQKLMELCRSYHNMTLTFTV